MRKNNGYVLLITLIFMQLLALLSMQMLTSIAADKKQARVQGQQLVARAKARQLLAGMSEEEGCIGPHLASGQVGQKPLLWWREQACQRRSAEAIFYFYRELLGEDGCAIIGSRAALYERVTLMLLVDGNFYQSVILQATIAKVGHSQPECAGAPRDLAPGWQNSLIIKG